MMVGGWFVMVIVVGGVYCVLGGVCGGEIRIVEMFCLNGCFLVVGWYFKLLLSKLLGGCFVGG